MRYAVAFAAVLLCFADFAGAQPPDRERGGARAPADDVNGFVARMMAFDKNKDGKLTRDEITDERLQRLFDRADTNKDGTVTREELEALAAKEVQGGGRGQGGPGGAGGGPGGAGGRGGPGGGPGGPGGRGPGGFG